MSCGPGGANASSAAQPAATESFEIISAAQPVNTYSCCRLDVRWQVEHSGKWWDIPQSATIDWFYTESAPGVTYNYDWEDGRISRYELHFAKREQVNMDTRGRVHHQQPGPAGHSRLSRSFVWLACLGIQLCGNPGRPAH